MLLYTPLTPQRKYILHLCYVTELQKNVSCSSLTNKFQQKTVWLIWFYLWHILLSGELNHLFCGWNLITGHKFTKWSKVGLILKVSVESNELCSNRSSTRMVQGSLRNKLILFWVCVIPKFDLHLYQTSTWQLDIWHTQPCKKYILR